VKSPNSRQNTNKLP
jgi:hypothetical protein